MPPETAAVTGAFVATEINPRLGGGLPLSVAAGADWPGWILDLCQGREPNTKTAIVDGLVMSRYDQSVFLTREDMDKLNRYPPAAEIRNDGTVR